MYKIIPPYLVMLCLLILFNTSNAAPATVYNWAMLTPAQNDTPTRHIASQLLVKYAQQLSNGRLQISLLPSKQSSTNQKIWDSLKRGQYPIAHISANSWQDIDNKIPLFASRPFGMISPEISAWFYEGGGLALMQKAYQPHGLLAFPGGSSGSQMSGWFKTPIKSVKDLNGLRMHVNGLSGTVLNKLGVSAVTLPDEQLENALLNNQIDAVKLGGPAQDNHKNFGQLAPYYYTAWNEPNAESQFLINQKAYAKLPKNLQYILRTAMRLAAYDAYIETRHNNATQLQTLRQRYPALKIQALPTNVMLALKRQTDKSTQDLVKNDPLATEILSSLQHYQRQIRLWTRIGDQAYLNNLGL